MKIKLINLILISIITVALVTSVIVFASNYIVHPNDNSAETEQQYDDIREDAPKTRMYTSSDGEQTELTYFFSRGEGESTRDTYKDAEGNWYTYDIEGNFLGVFLGAEIMFGSDGDNEKTDSAGLNAAGTENLSPSEQAVSVARAYAAKYFPDDFDGMTLYKILETTDTPEPDDEFDIDFAKTYGKGGFIKGVSCNVTVRRGKVVGCKISSDKDKLKDFNGELAEDVTMDELIAFALERSNEIFNIPYETESSQFSIDKIDGKYVIKITVLYKTQTDLSDEIVKEYDVVPQMLKTIDTSRYYAVYHYYPLEP